ncbi:MAG TPA: CPBP family intramembrane glutamic endopeptidase [Pyrinomonadaceae bacterium]|jgi:membrane protease YdiL (CAAX protease family)
MDACAARSFSRTKTKPTVFLWIEWALLFIATPLALRIFWKPSLFFISLLVGTITVFVWLLCLRKFDCKQFWRGVSTRGEWRQLKKIFLRFGVCSALITALVFFAFPDNLFNFPIERPVVWASVMILYPLLSVYPQELIYRAFFFERYRKLFPSSWATVLSSAIVFGLVHIIFQNPIAVILTLVGGVFFAETYARTRSLRLVWLEHALYGCLIFTIGLGEFFYHASVPAVQ